MRQKKKRVTKDLIRKYFGKGVGIRSRWLADGYKITTETGELLISNADITIVFGGDDIYRAATLLAQELWGGGKAYGSCEAVMAWMAHGEACGVNMRPGVKRSRFWRLVLGFFICCGVVGGSVGGGSGFLLALIAGAIWWLMERSAKRKEQRLAAQMGFAFPRVHGTASAASDEDLEREGWL